MALVLSHWSGTWVLLWIAMREEGDWRIGADLWKIRAVAL
jgi:hypothetical protein